MYKPPGAYIWRGDLTEGVLPNEFWGLIHGGAYFQTFSIALQTPGVLPYNLWAILVCGMCFISGGGQDILLQFDSGAGSICFFIIPDY